MRVIASCLFVLSAVLGIPAAASAATIELSFLLANPSFEAAGSGCPASWLCSGSPGGDVYTPGVAQFVPGADGLGPGMIVPDGDRAGRIPSALAGSGVIGQTLSSTWVVGQEYSLTFWVGIPAISPFDGNPNVGPSGALRLMILTGGTPGVSLGVTDGLCGGNPCQMDIVSPSAPPPLPGQWLQYVYIFTPTQGGGTNIGLQFFASTDVNHQEANFDFVPPTISRRSSDVPEPSTFVLLGSTLLGAAMFVRRRRASSPKL